MKNKKLNINMMIAGVLTLLFFSLAFFCIGQKIAKEKLTGGMKIELRDYWACLDGCYNAQIPMGIHNKTLFDQCSDICWDRMYEGNREKIEVWI